VIKAKLEFLMMYMFLKGYKMLSHKNQLNPHKFSIIFQTDVTKKKLNNFHGIKMKKKNSHN
jgi:hypothetical protein